MGIFIFSGLHSETVPSVGSKPSGAWVLLLLSTRRCSRRSYPPVPEKRQPEACITVTSQPQFPLLRSPCRTRGKFCFTWVVSSVTAPADAKLSPRHAWDQHAGEAALMPRVP